MALQQEDKLVYSEYHKDAQHTILLIHGGFATGQEWSGVVDLLPQYHILVPDLPGHGRSQVYGTHFSLHECVDQLAAFTRTLAHGSKAYIIGLSLGAHIGVHLVSRYPDIVNGNAILSGYNSYPTLSNKVLAGPAWCLSRIAHTFLSSSSESDESEFSYAPWELCKEVASVITTEDWPKSWAARTLIISAARKGPLPVADRDDNAQRLQEIGQQLNPATAAYKHTGIRHAWHKENPRLFADMVVAWLNNSILPGGFMRL